MTNSLVPELRGNKQLYPYLVSICTREYVPNMAKDGTLLPFEANVNEIFVVSPALGRSLPVTCPHSRGPSDNLPSYFNVTSASSLEPRKEKNALRF